MCQSSIKSSLCPGPRLGIGIEPGTDKDTRCRGCKTLARDVGKASGKAAVRPGDGVPPLPPAPSGTYAVALAVGRVNKAVDVASTNPVQAGLALGDEWAHFAEAFLIDVMDKCCEGRPPGAFALVVAGSLARKQATPYSDLEFFFVVELADDVVPFARLAKRMWESLKHVNKRTGAFSADAWFHEEGESNALTTTCAGLYVDAENGRVQFDGGLIEQIAKFTAGANFEQVSGARCVAGSPELLESLKLNIREGRSTFSYVNDFRHRLAGDIIPALDDAKKALLQQKSKIDIKAAILRTLLWVTIDLGRYYGLHGVGDIAHMTLLKNHDRISQEVYMMMIKALNDAQQARFQVHMAKAREHDVAKVTPELKGCFRAASALVEMSDIWVKQHLYLHRSKVNRESIDRLTSCVKTNPFLDSRTDPYDYLKVASLL